MLGGHWRHSLAADLLLKPVLVEIGAAAVPQIRVFNKCDLAGHVPGVERDGCGTISTVRLSALTGAGTADLRAALAERFPFQKTAEELPVAASEPENAAWPRSA